MGASCLCYVTFHSPLPRCQGLTGHDHCCFLHEDWSQFTVFDKRKDGRKWAQGRHKAWLLETIDVRTDLPGSSIATRSHDQSTNPHHNYTSLQMPLHRNTPPPRQIHLNPVPQAASTRAVSSHPTSGGLLADAGDQDSWLQVASGGLDFQNTEPQRDEPSIDRNSQVDPTVGLQSHWQEGHPAAQSLISPWDARYRNLREIDPPSRASSPAPSYHSVAEGGTVILNPETYVDHLTAEDIAAITSPLPASTPLVTNSYHNTGESLIQQAMSEPSDSPTTTNPFGETSDGDSDIAVLAYDESSSSDAETIEESDSEPEAGAIAYPAAMTSRTITCSSHPPRLQEPDTGPAFRHSTVQSAIAELAENTEDPEQYKHLQLYQSEIMPFIRPETNEADVIQLVRTAAVGKARRNASRSSRGAHSGSTTRPPSRSFASSSQLGISFTSSDVMATLEAATDGLAGLSPEASEAGPSTLAPDAEPVAEVGGLELADPEAGEELIDDRAISQRKSNRNKKLPSRYRENGMEDLAPSEEDEPEPLRSLNDGVEVQSESPGSSNETNLASGSCSSSRDSKPLKWWASRKNKFGLRRCFFAREIPTRDPDQLVQERDVDNSNEACGGTHDKAIRRTAGSKPFSVPRSCIRVNYNPSKAIPKYYARIISALGKYSSATVEAGANEQEAEAEAEAEDEDTDEWMDDAGWRTTHVSIPVPFHKAMNGAGIERRTVGTLHHRSILEILRDKVRSTIDGPRFHYQPYYMEWAQTQENMAIPPLRIHGELYTSEAFMEAHHALQSSPPVPGCNRERVIASLMFWSDATKLTDFGPSKLWPCYMFFGNESKYRRAKPNLHLGEHVAYFDSLADDFKDYLRRRGGGKLPPAELITHCSREMFQAQWALLLDDDLVRAMTDGIILVCHDNIERRFYPRIFTYSADYPEKVMIALIKQGGKYPCIQCLTPKTELHNMGTPKDIEFRRENPRLHDKHHQKMLTKALGNVKAGYAVTGDKVGGHLETRSMLPIQNSFHHRLKKLDFDIFPCLVVDLLHEFELGVWKNTFKHLLRLLLALKEGQNPTAELDERFRQVPPFGESTIRQFSDNASEMKRKAARDYEDLLQCSIPVFKALMGDPHDEIVMALLFFLCRWHALAKLRLHHELTLQMLEETTILLSSQFRTFKKDTCDNINTVELPKEAQARARRNAKNWTSEDGLVQEQVQGSSEEMPATTAKGKSRRPKQLNISTYKYHALGHYVSNIRRYGTTDSFTPEVGELLHRSPKTWFKRTDRRRFRPQIAGVERRRARLRRIKVNVDSEEAILQKALRTECSPGWTAQSSTRYNIGTSKSHQDLNEDFTNKPDAIQNPALVDFISKLKTHLLPRVQKLLAPELYCGSREINQDDKSWHNVVLQHNRIYTHKIMQVKYTTYDIRREADVLHLDTPRSNIMVIDEGYKTGQSKHMSKYGHVIGIFHSEVSFVGQLQDGARCYDRHRLDYLWVRWYMIDEQSLRPNSLVQVRFIPVTRKDAFGFLDPRRVIRAAHLIPRFAGGRHPEGDQMSFSWSNGKPDWRSFYVNQFVDRDMFMRYEANQGIGHVAIRKHIQSRPLSLDNDVRSSRPLVGPLTHEEVVSDAEESDTSSYPGSDDED
ncbi:hypothetical protein FA15DRAFT_707242 [Coprinopsis marcescibilis]|uniref:Uncharacterized protein n=1 Tax=Coprinopsis marcescibilis TaxID=230819 RepID=A0A5C3KM06_COPMA|nr:hypothetical protein FA15DRAFT_707242 [Coprinopsis marcescibilis]